MSFESLSILRQIYSCPMDFGVAIPHHKLTDVNYRKIVPYVFDSITCENEMKPNYIRTDSRATTANYNTPASYDYTKSDAIVTFAKDHNMKIVGHVLWYEPSNLPKFVKDLSNNRTLTPTLMSNIVNNHITNVITHFHSLARDTVYSWQVLNEALDGSGNMQTDQIIQRLLGNTSHSNLYQYAQNVLLPTGINKPNIKLFYNDYIDLTEPKIFSSLLRLKNAYILDGVGIQCHGTAPVTLEAMTLKYVKEGFEVHFTEVDNASDFSDSALTAWYIEVIRIALKYGVRNFTVWGLIDSSSWLYTKNSEQKTYTSLGQRTPRYPLLFDSTFTPKACYNALINEIKIFGNQAYDVIIILGQSNSVGGGILEYKFDIPGGGFYDMRTKTFYDDDFDNKFDDRIKSYSYNNRIVPAFEKLDSSIALGTRKIYGFGVSFARQYIKEAKLATGRKVLLINCGVSGTGFLNTAATYTWNTTVSPNLYEFALKRIKSALSSINTSSTVKAILWHQGESDAGGIFNTPATVTSKSDLYTSLLTTMLNSLRTNIGSPTTSIILGGLCPSYYINHFLSDKNESINNRTPFPDTNIQRMNGLISSIASRYNYRFVSTEPISAVSDFNHYLKGNPGDNVHFSKSSQIEFGKRYFYVYNGSIRLT